MATLKTFLRGESVTINFLLNAEYLLENIEEIKVYLGSKLVASELTDRTVSCKIPSNTTKDFGTVNKLTFWFDDTLLGVQKLYVGDICFDGTNAISSNESIKTVADVIIPITINETAITVGGVVYDYVKGDKGDTGNGIQSITLLATVGLVKSYRILFTDSTTFDYDITDGQNGTNGIDGSDGNGIASITLLSTVGLVKTYRITYTDATTFDYEVTDGADGTNGTDGITYYTENHKEDLSSQVDGVNKVFTLLYAPMDTPCVDFRVSGFEAEFDIIVNGNEVTLSYAPAIGSKVTCFYQTNTTAIPNIAGKQDKTDLSLATTDKTVVGAINEVRTTANGKENIGIAQSLITQLINGAASGYDTLKELEDKIIAINSIIGGSAPDGDSIVNTVAELLAVFATFPEGSDMVTLLTAKLNTSDVYNALDQLLAGKALDARQGKVLNDLCTGLRTDLTNHNHSGVYEPVISKSSGILSWSGSAWVWISSTISDGWSTASSWVATNGTNVLNHIGIIAGNPHGTTASQVGAYTSGQTDTLLLNKVDKEVGKGLSEINLTHEMAEIYGNTVSTGWSEQIGLTQVDSTHVSVNAAEGFIIYNTGVNSEAPILNEVEFAGATNVLISNIATSDITYFLVNVSGVLYQQTTYPTPEQRRDNLFIGRVSHPNRTSILAIVNTPDNETSPMSQLRDMFDGMKLMNNGISVYADGANLGFNISGGKLTGLGINASVNVQNPNQVTIAGKIPASFYYRTITGGSTGLVSVLTPGFYDVGGTITAISTGGDSQANRSTNVRIYQFSNGNVVAQYGQTVYSSLALAVAGIPTEQFVQFSNVKENAILIGIISVRRAATVLNNTSFAIFTPASMFGEVVNSTNGTSITDLQGIYGNSSTPEILTDDTRLGLTLKDGTSSPTNNQFEVLNFNGVLKSSINGNGNYESFPDYGAEGAPTFAIGDWTLTSGWEATNAGGTALDKSSAGTTAATAIGGLTVVSGSVYRVSFTVGDSISGGAFVSGLSSTFGGNSNPTVTAVGTYTYIIRANNANKLVFNPTPNGSRFSITSISIQQITTSVGQLKIGGDLIFGSRMLNSNGIDCMYIYPNGDIAFPTGTFRPNSITGGTVTSSSTITGRQLATTTGTSATTTGAITLTLSSNGNYWSNAALTGGITYNITAPVAGGCNKIFIKQGATAQTVTLSLTGVTWNLTNSSTTSTNTLSVTGISSVNNYYVIEMNWVSTTVCFVTVK